MLEETIALGADRAFLINTGTRNLLANDVDDVPIGRDEALRTVELLRVAKTIAALGTVV